MKKKDLTIPSGSRSPQVDCPACPGHLDLAELIRLEQVRCPKCGNDWRVRAQDVPGRVLVDLLPLKS